MSRDMGALRHMIIVACIRNIIIIIDMRPGALPDPHTRHFEMVTTGTRTGRLNSGVVCSATCS